MFPFFLFLSFVFFFSVIAFYFSSFIEPLILLSKSSGQSHYSSFSMSHAYSMPFFYKNKNQTETQKNFR